MLLAPLHSASSSASLLVDHSVVRPLRLGTFRRGRLQTTTLRSGRRLPDGRHRRRLMIRLVDHGSWIADLAIENTRIHGYTRAAETSTLGALATVSIPISSPLPQNFRKARAIYPSVIYPLRRPGSPSDSRTRDLGPTACTLHARSSLDRPRTRSEPRQRAVSFYHREGDGSTSLCKRKIDVDPHILRPRARAREREKRRGR